MNFEIINGNLFNSPGGGIWEGDHARLTIKNCSIHNNNGTSGGGIYSNHDGDITIINTTIGENTASIGGAIDAVQLGQLHIRNSTIYNNTAITSAGGISLRNTGQYSSASFKNSIITGNSAPINPNCSVGQNIIHSSEYNLIQDSTGCNYTQSYGDVLYWNAKLGSLLPTGVYFMSPLSPAVDAGNPLTPGSGGYACEADDQLGVVRPIDGNHDSKTRCDIGAYESNTPFYSQVITNLNVVDGSNQANQIFGKYQPLDVIVRDQYGVPISGVTVTFTSPEVGPSGIFSDTKTNSTTAVTDSNGIASSSILTANSITGSFMVEATVSGIDNPVNFQLLNRDFWYVTTLGNDSNDCVTTTTSCATIQGALDKAVSGDTIKITAETYQGTNPNIVNISKDITLIGGWDSTFTSRVGMTRLDGQTIRRGMYIVNSTTQLIVFIINFEITNGNLGGADGSGIYVGSQSNVSIINSLIHNNYSNYGGGIYSAQAKSLSIIKSTIGENSAKSGGGIFSYLTGQINLSNSTIYNNSTTTIAGGINIEGVYYLNNKVVLQNTVIAGNYSPQNPDCWLNNENKVISNGYNLIQNINGCSFTPSIEDIVGQDVKFGSLLPTGVYFISPLSPVIDAGNPLPPGSEGSACEADDQIGTIRPIDGNFDSVARCDIGAYESTAPLYSPVATALDIVGVPDQSVQFFAKYQPFSVLVRDQYGVPLPGAIVTFTAPASGPSGIFSDTKTNISTTVTDSSGVAISSTLTANNILGTFFVEASVSGIENTVNFQLVNRDFWYVSTLGNDSNDCNTPIMSCASLRSILNKVVSGDAILIATGNYNSNNLPGLPTNISLTLRGGWDNSFSGQTGLSTLDGGGSTGTVLMLSNSGTFLLERLRVQNGETGISNGGNTTIRQSIITGNNVGIRANKTVYVIDSTINGNGVGIDMSGGPLTINNSTIWNNSKAIENRSTGTVTLQNSIIGGNTQIGSTSRCNSLLHSAGYNIFDIDCAISALPTDLIGVDPQLSNLLPGGFQVPLPGSPAIDAGNPAAPGSGGNACEGIDQAGISRPIDGNTDGNSTCDIGAVEFSGGGSIPLYIYPSQGTFRMADPGEMVSIPIGASILDEKGKGVAGVDVTFTAPSTGASGVFSTNGSNTISITTNDLGLALPGDFLVNESTGYFTIHATAVGLDTSVNFGIVNGAKVSTYSMDHNSEYSRSLPGRFVCDESQPECTNGIDRDADHAQAYAIDTLLFYLHHHNRLGLDGDGLPLTNSVHYNNFYENSFWDGYEAVYGDNQPVDDVVGHELTHGVTDYSSGLFYYYQSGAISESFSDLWGEFIDQTNGAGNDSPNVKWELGEDNHIDRSMSDPSHYKQPDRMTSDYYHHGDMEDDNKFDNGGVHTNNGVNNKAVFLMTDGGTFNGYNVAGLGLDKVAAIYYEAQTHILVSGSNYKDLYYGLHQACLNVIGGPEDVNLKDCAEVQKALDAVEMYISPLTNFLPEAQLCPNNAQPKNLFFDDFETANGNWNYTSHVPADVFWERVWGYAAGGEYSIYAPDVNTTSNIFLMMASGVNIPSSDTAYLYFKHSFGFETNLDYYSIDRAWDGGVLEYRVDNGGWQDANPLFDSGQGYNGSIYKYGTNSLGGRLSFVGDSHGYVSSRYKLNTAALKGHNVNFRWRIGTDGYVGDFGWLLDDVRIYTCQTTSPGVEIFADDFSIAKGWTDNAGGLVVRDASNQVLNWTSRQDTPLHYTIPIYASNDPIQLDFRFKVNSTIDNALLWVGLADDLDQLSPGVMGADLAGTFLGIDSTNKIQLLNVLPDQTYSHIDSIASTLEYGGNNVWRRTTFTINGLDWNLVVKDDNGTKVGEMSGSLTQRQERYKYLVLMYNNGGGTGSVSGAIDDIKIYGNACHTLSLSHTGSGTDASASPVNSSICPTGMYLSGEEIQLSNAQPDPGWIISCWAGTGKDSSVSNTNTLTMPNKDHSAAVNYKVDTALYTISGKVVTLIGTPLAAVTVSDGMGHSSITDVNGNYKLLKVSAGIRTITPSKAGFTFTPVNRQVRVGPNATGIEFVADNQVPANIKLVPNAAIPGSPSFTLVVTGSYFVDNSVIRWNGEDRPTTFINSTSLTTPIDASDIAALGTASVTVFNPAPGGGISNPVLFSIVNYSPVYGQKLASNKISFDWDDIPGAEGYSLQLALNETFSSIVLNVGITTSNYSYIYALTNGYTYYWRIRPKIGSVWGDWLPAWKFFSMNPPVAPVLASPLNARLTNDTTPDFSWNTVTNGDHYQIQVSRSTTFIPVITEETLAPGVLNFTSTNLTDGIHYWRVRAIDSVGVFGAWSASRSFTIDTMPPAVPGLFLPANESSVRGTPAYSWSIPVGANAYQFEYDDTTEFVDPIFTSAVLTSSVYTTPVQPIGTYYWHVKARDIAGNWGDWSSPRTITILPLIPGGPVLTSPVSGYLTNDTTPTLTWNVVPYGVKYQVQVSKISTFTTTVQDVTLDPDLVTIDLAALADGKYFWRVRAINANSEPGGWSIFRYITVDTIPQAVPVPVAPANGGIVLKTIPQMTVGAVVGAKYYQFQVDDADDFGTPLADVTKTTNSFIPTAAQALPFGTIYWRARSIDAAGNASGWSTPRSFIVTILKTPVNLSYSTITKPVFSWAAATGALAYRIQVDNSDLFDSPEMDVTRPKSTSYTPLTALPHNIYYWRIQVQTAAGWGNWTPVFTFTVTPPLPVGPTLTAPASAAITNDNTPTLNWNAVTGGAKYEIQISKLAAFTTMEQTVTLDPGVLTYTVDTLPDALQYWRVRAINALNVSGAWSAIRYFTVDTTPQAVPTLVSPANGGIVLTTIPKMTVGTVSGAKYYQFQVDDAEDFVTPLLDVTKNTNYNIPTAAQALPFGTAYWRVRSIDAAGNASGWSSARSFIVTILKTPVNLSYSTVTKPVFSWMPISGALAYRIQVDSSDIFDSPEMDVTRPVSIRYVPLTGLPYNIYYWHMQVQTAAGWGNWTPVFTFTVTPPLPVAPVLTAPVSGTITNDNTPTFNWNAVAGGAKYEIQISKTAAFTTLEQTTTLDPGILTFTADLLPDTPHYWRVRAINDLNIPGAWSAYRYFVVDTVSPAIPVLVAPAAGASIRVTPRYTWLAAAGARYYQFAYSATSDFSDIIFTSGELTTLYLTPPAQVPGTYYWHVRAKDIAGNWGDWSTARQVTIIP